MGEMTGPGTEDGTTRQLSAANRMRWGLVVAVGVLWVFLIGRSVNAQGEVPPPELREVSEVAQEIQQASSLPGAALIAETLRAETAIWIDRIHIGRDNAYTPDSNKYLTASLTILNRGATPLEIQAGQTTLLGWNKTYSVHSDASDVRDMPIQVERESRMLSELNTPDELTVPAGKSVSFEVFFLNVQQGNTVGPLLLHVPLKSGGVLEVDIRAQQRARLGIESARMGPEAVLGLVTIHGSLNTVNAEDLADEIRTLIDDGVQRMVITWADNAAAMAPDLVDWLLERAAGDSRDPLYEQLPHFPTPNSLALAALPEVNREDGGYDENETLFATADAAVQHALRELYTVIDAAYLSKEIRSGHPFSQRAALAALELRQDRLSLNNLFPVLSQLYDSVDEQTRKYVLLAIGQQRDPGMLDMLASVVTEENATDAAAGFAALLKSPVPEAVATLEEIIESRSARFAYARQIEMLGSDYRREWNPFLLDALQDSEADVRAAAIRSLVKVGHRRIIDHLRDALADPDEHVRNVAFAALVQRTDSASEQLALEHALQLLQQGEVHENVLEIVRRTRDLRTARHIVEQIRHHSEHRSQLLNVLEDVGDERALRDLLQIDEQLTSGQRIQLYQLVVTFDLPEQTDIALKALRAEEQEIRQIGIEMLVQQATDEAADAIFQLYPDATPPEATVICFALGRIGTERAARHLKQIRQSAFESADEERLEAAKDGMRIWVSHSPGANSLETAYYHSRVENYENALTYFKLAAEIDPQLGIAWSGQGNSYLKLQQYDEAGEAFAKAYEIDDFDGQAITGLGIVEAMRGEVEAAVERTVSAAGKFPNDEIYAYNTACVYGRAIEFLRREGTDEQRQLVQSYEAAAISALKDSIEWGFSEWSLMQTDPDLNALRELPAFRELSKNRRVPRP